MMIKPDKCVARWFVLTYLMLDQSWSSDQDPFITRQKKTTTIEARLVKKLGCLKNGHFLISFNELVQLLFRKSLTSLYPGLQL
jgi:hypothetical protein